MTLSIMITTGLLISPPIIIDFRYESNIDIGFMLKAVTHKDTSAIDKEEYKRLLENIQI